MRRALLADKDYQTLLKEKKNKLESKIGASLVDKKRYVLSTEVDFDILDKCKKLERLELTEQDRDLVILIKAQVEDDWRKPLMVRLGQLLRKYKKLIKK